MKKASFLLLLILFSCSNEAVDNAIGASNEDDLNSEIDFDTVSIPGLIGVPFEDVSFEDMDTNYIKKLRIHPGIIDVVEGSIEYLPSQRIEGSRKASTAQIAYNQLIELSPDLKGQIKYWTEYKEHYIFSLNEVIEGDEDWDYWFIYIYYIKKNGKIYMPFAPK